jgi:hypothetical protein
VSVLTDFRGESVINVKLDTTTILLVCLVLAMSPELQKMSATREVDNVSANKDMEDLDVINVFLLTQDTLIVQLVTAIKQDQHLLFVLQLENVDACQPLED